MVDSVKETMNEWKEKGYAEFLTEEPLACPGLTQVFTKPSELTGLKGCKIGFLISDDLT